MVAGTTRRSRSTSPTSNRLPRCFSKPSCLRLWQRDKAQSLVRTRLSVGTAGRYRLPDHAVDEMTERAVAMFMLGPPFTPSYSIPRGVAYMLSGDLLNACDRVGQAQQTPAAGRLAT